MRRYYLLPAAYLLDLAAGDPECFPHPVRLMGFAISEGERALRGPDCPAVSEVLSGAALAIGVVAASFYGTRTLVRTAYRRSRLLGCATEIVLAWTCIAARNLQQEAKAVLVALERQDLPKARKRLARIVGRDTEALDATEISRALIETLAESASDGIVAPILYLAIGGTPLAMAFKAISTLDSMIGHRNRQYLYFGKVAARLDDAANYLPSRLTALSIVCASAMYGRADSRAAWSTWRQDGSKHKSPNAGQPEAAMSGALRVQLGGDNEYDGERISSPRIGKGFPAATPAAARHALRLTAVTALIGLAVGMLLTIPRRSDI